MSCCGGAVREVHTVKSPGPSRHSQTIPVRRSEGVVEKSSTPPAVKPPIFEDPHEPLQQAAASDRHTDKRRELRHPQTPRSRLPEHVVQRRDMTERKPALGESSRSAARPASEDLLETLRQLSTSPRSPDETANVLLDLLERGCLGVIEETESEDNAEDDYDSAEEEAARELRGVLRYCPETPDGPVSPEDISPTPRPAIGHSNSTTSVRINIETQVRVVEYRAASVPTTPELMGKAVDKKGARSADSTGHRTGTRSRHQQQVDDATHLIPTAIHHHGILDTSYTSDTKSPLRQGKPGPSSKQEPASRSTTKEPASTQSYMADSPSSHSTSFRRHITHQVSQRRSDGQRPGRPKSPDPSQHLHTDLPLSENPTISYFTVTETHHSDVPKTPSPQPKSPMIDPGSIERPMTQVDDWESAGLAESTALPSPLPAREDRFDVARAPKKVEEDEAAEEQKKTTLHSTMEGGGSRPALAAMASPQAREIERYEPHHSMRGGAKGSCSLSECISSIFCGLGEKQPTKPHDEHRPRLSRPETHPRPDRSALPGRNTNVISTVVAPEPSAGAKAVISRWEARLRAKIFKEAVKVSASEPEPAWAVPDDSAARLFPTPEPFQRYPLTPLGRCVAEMNEALNTALKEAELSVHLTVSGVGAELRTRGLLQLLRPDQWLNIWRSKTREVHVSAALFPRSCTEAPLDQSELERLQDIENELVGLQKYRGGESEFVTVITFSGEPSTGAVELFKASFGEDHSITQLDLVAYLREMPREICRILCKSVKRNEYRLILSGDNIKCDRMGHLPRPRPAVVSSSKVVWANVGSGWRKAMHIILHDSDAPREGLVATIPQMLAFLHLRYGLINKFPMSPVFRFENPLAWVSPARATSSVTRQIRRGVKLHGLPEGMSHVGNDITIAVLFPGDSAWAREQFFWA